MNRLIQDKQTHMVQVTIIMKEEAPAVTAAVEEEEIEMIIKISNNNLHITKMAIETDTDFIKYEKKNFLKILFWVFRINVKTKLQFNLFLSIIIYVKKYIYFLMFHFSVFFQLNM
jgi:hypothetical protein